MSAAPAAFPRVVAGSPDDLRSRRLLLVKLQPGALGRPREALVVLDQHDRAHAYLNQCQHLPIPLDGGSRQFFAGPELQCGTHGARYRLSDGLCVAGPCRGKSLLSLDLELIAGLICVVDDPSVGF